MPRVIRCGTVARSIVRIVKRYDNAIVIVAVEYDYPLGYECQHLHVRGRCVNVVANSIGEAIGLIVLVLGPILGQVIQVAFSSGSGQEVRPYGDPYTHYHNH